MGLGRGQGLDRNERALHGGPWQVTRGGVRWVDVFSSGPQFPLPTPVWGSSLSALVESSPLASLNPGLLFPSPSLRCAPSAVRVAWGGREAGEIHPQATEIDLPPVHFQRGKIYRRLPSPPLPSAPLPSLLRNWQSAKEPPSSRGGPGLPSAAATPIRSFSGPWLLHPSKSLL